jgi:hypothetical protein
MASKFCTKCGAPTIDGKRFCGKCGQPLASSAVVADVTGQAVEAVAVQLAPNPADSVSVAAITPSLQTELREEPLPSSVDAQVVNPALVSSVNEFVPAVAASSPIPPVANEASSPVAPVAAEPGGPVVTSPIRTRPVAQTALIAGGVALALILALSAVWVHVSHFRAKRAAIAAESAQPLTGASTTSDFSGSGNKPSAATQAAPTPNVPAPSGQVQQQPSPSSANVVPEKKAPAAPAPVQLSNANIPPNPPGQQREAAPAMPTSGVLHYSGPPVPFGGTVVFANLPGERLSFIFDHQAWQPLISHQPDGAQKLTLRSLKQGVQTQCDVGWKVIKE